MKTNTRTTLCAKRLRECREEAGETLEQVGQLLGVNRSTVMRWEKGDNSVSRSALLCLAEHYGVSSAWLSGASSDRQARAEKWLSLHATPIGQVKYLPVLGAVRAGIGGEIFEEVIGQEAVDTEMLSKDYEYFWLKVTGDSMAPVLSEGDLVLVRKQAYADSGSLAVVMVNGEEGLVKKIVTGDGFVELHSFNPYYPMRRFDTSVSDTVVVLGVVLESRRRFM